MYEVSVVVLRGTNDDVKDEGIQHRTGDSLPKTSTVPEVVPAAAANVVVLETPPYVVLIVKTPAKVRTQSQLVLRGRRRQGSALLEPTHRLAQNQ